MELEKVLVIDPVTNVEETYKTKEVVYKSNVNSSLYKYVADSQSTTNIIFNNITPPSLNTVINRCLKLKYSLFVTVLGTNNAAPTQKAAAIVAATGAPLLAGPSESGDIFLADSPLQTASSAIELRINGSSTSTSPQDYVQIYSHMVSKDDLNMFSTTYPHQKDNMAVYLDNDALNYRAPYQSLNVNTDLQPRAASVWTYLGPQAVTNADQYRVDVMEDLYISPCVWGELANKCAGLSNINNLTLNIRIADLNRAVRCKSTNAHQFIAAVSPITSITTNFTNPNANAPPRNAELEIQYITPDPVLAAKMPSVVVYDYDYIQTFLTSASNLQQFNTSLVFQSIRLPSIPKRLFIYAKPSKRYINVAPYDNTVPDFFLPLENIKITFNNRINLLANDIPQTLYNKSVANGLTDSFYEWQYGCGSVMIVDVAKDLGLEADECVGQANKYSTLQIEATFSNTNLTYQGVSAAGVMGTPAGYDYYIVVENTGKAFVTASDCQFVLTGPSSAEVLALTSSLDKVADQSDLDGKQVGGGAFGKIGKLFKSGLNLVKNIDPEQVASGVRSVQNAMGSLGLGVAGGAMKHRRVH